MKCERCGKELSDADLYCSRCGQAVFPEYMDETDVWAYYKSDEELEQILKKEQEADSLEVSEKEEEAQKTDTSVQEVQTEADFAKGKCLEKIKKGFWGRRKEKKAESVENPKEEGSAEKAGAEKEENADFEVGENADNSETLTETAGEEIERKEAPALENSMKDPESAITNLAEESEESEPETESDSLEDPMESEPEIEVFTEEADKEEPEVTAFLEQETAENPEPEECIQEPEEESEAFLEEENFFAEEDEKEEKEKQPLPPERRKSRRRTVLLSTLFLTLCLAAGIALGFHKIKEMEQQEKAYYQETVNKNSKEAVKEKSSEVAAPAEGQKKEEFFKLIKAEEIDFSKYKKIQPKGTEENSVKQSENYDYSAKSVVDGNASTSWQENEEGTGEGKGIKLSLDGIHKIRYMVLYLGNWRSDELWQYNSRPKVLTIQVGDKQKKEVEFSDEKKKFCLSFDEPVEASYVSLYLKSAYEGSRWQDTCISEVELYE